MNFYKNGEKPGVQVQASTSLMETSAYHYATTSSLHLASHIQKAAFTFCEGQQHLPRVTNICSYVPFSHVSF